MVSRSLRLSMTHKTPKIRSAMTAIAAVLTLSSSQLLAQTAPEATPPVSIAPVVTVPEVTPEATTPSEPPATSASETPVAEPTITKTRSSRSTTTHRTATVTRPARAAPQVARASERARAPDRVGDIGVARREVMIGGPRGSGPCAGDATRCSWRAAVSSAAERLGACGCSRVRR